MPLPDRWMNYKPYGTAIEGTKILAFKVPLKVTMVKHLLPEQQFTTGLLMNAFPKLKFVIDLTNTNRYYSKEEFTNAGVGYQKILVEGKKVPKLDCVKQFFKTMNDFHATAKDGELIGVHCTHGLNRTGYLVCRYLVQQLGWNLNNAIEEFNKARGHPIERQEYIEALKSVPKNQKLDTTNVKLGSKLPVDKKQNGKYKHKNKRQYDNERKSSRNNNYRNNHDHRRRPREPYPIAPHPSMLPMPHFSSQDNQQSHGRYGRMPEQNFNSNFNEIPYVNGGHLPAGPHLPVGPPIFNERKYSHRSMPYPPSMNDGSSIRRPNFYPPRLRETSDELLIKDYQPNYNRSLRHSDEHFGYRNNYHAEPIMPPSMPMAPSVPIPMGPSVPLPMAPPGPVDLPYQRSNYDSDRVNNNSYYNFRNRERIPRSGRQQSRH
ncbi:RNA/RNP complex-1-interacting phosphatase-like isoform X2 [Aphidius gifuensis]|uniref:RNA/RNP complex-1-interacting phosphatase-like isoform X2 n=1 Tax=Aphidius gifuensis TaxID=684658 RepID=UPI001CDBB22A|nr:RNA/RNP complex-1-interacting phosphatase-like isoform X2 [Aphidius gifuensis]